MYLKTPILTVNSEKILYLTILSSPQSQLTSSAVPPTGYPWRPDLICKLIICDRGNFKPYDRAWVKT